MFSNESIKIMFFVIIFLNCIVVYLALASTKQQNKVININHLEL